MEYQLNNLYQLLIISSMTLGFLLFVFSLFEFNSIIKLIYDGQSILFRKFITIWVALYFGFYVAAGILIYKGFTSDMLIMVSIVYLIGAILSYLIQRKFTYSIRLLSATNSELLESNKNLQQISDATANANANMSKIYLELEEKQKELADKESKLQQQIEVSSKMNLALADANANMAKLYMALEETKDELLDHEARLTQKNEELAKVNTALASANANMSKLYIDLEQAKMELVETEKIASMTKIFKKFVPEQFLGRLAKEGIEKIRYGYGEHADLTILFSDIRSFTTFAEDMNPTQLFNILNKYFAAVSEKIYQHGGFIDKFIGDAIMAIFERDEQANHSVAIEAVQAAVEMQQRLNQFNSEFSDILRVPITIGIGIHSGDVMVGTVGFESRMDSTVLGDNVNVAARIESLTREFKSKIIISESTLHQIPNPEKFHYRNLGLVRVKGKEKLLKLYEVFDCDNEDILKLKEQTKPYFERGVDFFQNNNLLRAKEEFRAALKIFPDDYAAKYLLERVERV